MGLRRLSLWFTICLAPGALDAQAVDHIALGIARSESRDPRAALEHFQMHLATDARSYEANWRAALALIDIGKQTADSIRSLQRDSLYTEAERYARTAAEANPDDAEGHFVLSVAIGRASLTKSTRERVRRASEIRLEALRAIELGPRHDGAYHVLGRWNAEVMRLSAMERFFARSFLGGSVFNQASWDRAVEYLEKAIALAPTNIYHHLDLAEIYIDRKRYAEARRHLEQIATLPVVDVMDPAYQEQAARLLTKIARRE
jgi:tetratricopeptide (TPR) repeat protein